MASHWCSTVERMGALHDPHAWTTHSLIPATNYKGRIKLFRRSRARTCQERFIVLDMIFFLYFICYVIQENWNRNIRAILYKRRKERKDAAPQKQISFQFELNVPARHSISLSVIFKHKIQSRFKCSWIQLSKSKF